MSLYLVQTERGFPALGPARHQQAHVRADNMEKAMAAFFGPYHRLDFEDLLSLKVDLVARTIIETLPKRPPPAGAPGPRTASRRSTKRPAARR